MISKGKSTQKVFIAVPVRNRDWIIKDYLDAIYNLDYPKNLIHLYFLINDSVDDTAEIIVDFLGNHQAEYLEIGWNKKKYGKPEGNREGITVSLYPHYAMLKNYVKRVFLEESSCDYWLQLDSDTLVRPDTLEKLLGHQVGYVCGVCNCDVKASPQSKELINVMKIKNGQMRRVCWKELEKTEKGQLFEGDWVGGLVLISRYIANNCNYHVIRTCSDDNRGFCSDIQKLGLKVWIDPEVFLNHFMVKDFYIEQRKNIYFPLLE